MSKTRNLVAIINDQPIQAAAIEAALLQLRCQAMRIAGRVKDDFLRAIIELIENKGIRFDGVVLDIMFQQGERRGGVDLWRDLCKASLDAKLGRVLVLTNSDESDLVREYFDSIERHDVIVSGATMVKAREDMLKALVELIDSDRQ